MARKPEYDVSTSYSEANRECVADDSGLNDNGAMLMRGMRYLWVLPTTGVGLAFLPPALVTGGGVQVVEGVIEIHGGAVAWLLRHATLVEGGASALTLGHVVLGVDRTMLDATRTHERVHVRQCERWGPLFIPAYLLASAWVWMHGRDAYRDNPFEIEAYKYG